MAMDLIDDYDEMEYNDSNLRFAKIKSSDLYITKMALSSKYNGHDGCINALSYSPDGQFVLTGSDDATVKVWNSLEKDPKCITTLRGHRTNVFAVSFLNDSSTIVSGGNDSDIRIYDLEKSKTCTVLQRHKRKVTSIKTDPYSPFVFYSTSADGSLKCFDTRKPYRNSITHSIDHLNSMGNAGIGDIDTFTSGILPQSLGGGIISRNDDSRNSEFESFEENIVKFDDTLYTVDVSPRNSNYILLACGDANAYLYDVRKVIGKPSYINIFSDITRNSDVTGASFDCYGKKVVSTYISGYIYMFDIEKSYEHDLGLNYFNRSRSQNAQTYEKIYKGHISEDTIKSVWFWGENSEYIVSGSDDGYIIIWDRETQEIVQILEGHNANVNNIAFHPQIPMFISSGIDSFALSWEPKTFEETPELIQRKENLFKMAKGREVHSDGEDDSARFLLRHLSRILRSQINMEGFSVFSYLLMDDDDEEDGDEEHEADSEDSDFEEMDSYEEESEVSDD